MNIITNIEIYFLLFSVYSILGWLMEVMVCFPINKKIVNRGFLIGPYCPIYGYGTFFITILLARYKEDIIITFIMAILICGILEYSTSFFMEKLFKARWWDYSDKKFNINGRICLENLIFFGICGCLILYITNPFIINLITQLPNILLNILALLLFVIYIVDNIISFKILVNLKYVSDKLKDNTEEISQKVKNIINRKSTLHRRLVAAFPLIKAKVKFNDWKVRIKKNEKNRKIS